MRWTIWYYICVFYTLVLLNFGIIRGDDLIRGVTFGWSGLIRGMTFGWSGLIRGVTFGWSGLINVGLVYSLCFAQKTIYAS